MQCVDDVCRIEAVAEVETAKDGEAEPMPEAGEIAEDGDGAAPAVRKNKPTKTSSSNALMKALHSQQELDAYTAQNEAVIVEFSTSWCGACKSIQPMYEELAGANSETVKAAQVMCDKNKETKKLAAAHGVSSYPVFVLFAQGKSDGRWEGADRGKLEKAFERLAGGGKGTGKKKAGRR